MKAEHPSRRLCVANQRTAEFAASTLSAGSSSRRSSRRPLAPIVTVIVLAFVLLLSAASEARAQTSTNGNSDDPRVDLRAGWTNAGISGRYLRLAANVPRPDAFMDPANPGDFSLANTDIGFSGDFAYLGGYNGLQVWDISDPQNPTLRNALVCPGGQGDVSIYGNLLFMSVEETRGRIDCGTEGAVDPISDERFRGVRIFDVSDVDEPRQVASVQTCRGSHTHTLVTDPADDENVYIYVSGTNQVRPEDELSGCSALPPEEDPNTSLFRIEVIRVPVAAPELAQVVSTPRIFADPETGDIAGLWRGGDSGEGTQQTAVTDQCHDITAYPELGLAAGACSGNGILLDIRDPADPKRIAEVSDPNFAYWHSATFSNDADKVLFTDEWGGGMAPRCRESDPETWGANAIFTLEEGDLQHAGYYKLPAVQTDVENCVAHNGSIIPVPGRDIMVQAWYQGGVSVFDFTDPSNPIEIAFYDRGPLDSTRLLVGGYWSTYWYNGYIYGSETFRGLDVFELMASEHLSQNEIEAAKLVRFDEFNPQHQTKFEWPATPVVARAYVDQLVRSRGITRDRAAHVREELDRLESGSSGAGTASSLRITDTIAELETAAQIAEEETGVGGHDANAERLRLLARALEDLAAGPVDH